MKNNNLFYYFIITLAFSWLASACTSNDSKQNRENDSIAIIDAVKKAYAWHMNDTSHFYFFPLQFKNNLIEGIDSIALNNGIKKLENLFFFSTSFIENYKNTALKINAVFQQDTMKYYQDEVPPYGPYDWDLFCNCQDGPEDFVGSMQFSSLIIQGDSASINWTWIQKEYEQANYTVKLEKENNNWKIANLQGMEELPTPKPY